MPWTVQARFGAKLYRRCCCFLRRGLLYWCRCVSVHGFGFLAAISVEPVPKLSCVTRAPMSDWQGKQARWGQSPGRNQEHGEPLHEGYNPQPEGPSRGRRWRRKGAKPPSPEPPPAEPGARVVWLLGNRCVELLLPSGEVRCSVLAADIKAGSRSVATSVPGRFYVLENGSSRIWQVWFNDVTAYICTRGELKGDVLDVLGCVGARQVELGKGAWPLCDETEARRFRASLGSRFVSCGPDGQWLLVTGTPHHGAHSPWLFDLETQRWRALPAAPHAILSSAVAVQPDGLEVTILGGWSKMSSCHGHVQRLTPRRQAAGIENQPPLLSPPPSPKGLKPALFVV